MPSREEEDREAKRKAREERRKSDSKSSSRGSNLREDTDRRAKDRERSSRSSGEPAQVGAFSSRDSKDPARTKDRSSRSGRTSGSSRTSGGGSSSNRDRREKDRARSSTRPASTPGAVSATNSSPRSRRERKKVGDPLTSSARSTRSSGSKNDKVAAKLAAAGLSDNTTSGSAAAAAGIGSPLLVDEKAPLADPEGELLVEALAVEDTIVVDNQLPQLPASSPAPAPAPPPPSEPEETEPPRQQNKNRGYKVVILLLLFGLGGGVAYFLATRGAKEEQVQGPAITEVPSAPPTVTLKYPAPSKDHCDRIAAGLEPQEDKPTVSRSYKLIMDVELSFEGSTLDLNSLENSMQAKFVPDLVGCSGTTLLAQNLINIQYVIYNGDVVLELLESETCQAGNASPCFVVQANLDLELQDDELPRDITSIILATVSSDDLVSQWNLLPPNKKVVVRDAEALDAVTASPVAVPTVTPDPGGQTVNPVASPTAVPTGGPDPNVSTGIPVASPTAVPTESPDPDVSTGIPVPSPTGTPTVGVVENPTVAPSVGLLATKEPTKMPTDTPSSTPSRLPTTVPTITTPNPTVTTGLPTRRPSVSPSMTPTMTPTKNPTTSPTKFPTKNPTTSPTQAPTAVCGGNTARSYNGNTVRGVQPVGWADLPFEVDLGFGSMRATYPGANPIGGGEFVLGYFSGHGPFGTDDYIWSYSNGESRNGCTAGRSGSVQMQFVSAAESYATYTDLTGCRYRIDLYISTATCALPADVTKNPTSTPTMAPTSCPVPAILPSPGPASGSELTGPHYVRVWPKYSHQGFGVYGNHRWYIYDTTEKARTGCQKHGLQLCPNPNSASATTYCIAGHFGDGSLGYWSNGQVSGCGYNGWNVWYGSGGTGNRMGGAYCCGTPMYLPEGPQSVSASYLYGSQEEAAAACAGKGLGLCSEQDVSGFTNLFLGWTSDGTKVTYNQGLVRGTNPTAGAYCCVTYDNICGTCDFDGNDLNSGHYVTPMPVDRNFPWIYNSREEAEAACNSIGLTLCPKAGITGYSMCTNSWLSDGAGWWMSYNAGGGCGTAGYNNRDNTPSPNPDYGLGAFCCGCHMSM